MAGQKSTAPQAMAAVKFVQQDAAGLPVKRRQVQQACESCKRRKKRCEHTQEHDVMDASDAAAQLLQFHAQAEAVSPAGTSSGTSSTAVPSPDTRHAKLDRAAPFLSDLNPEGVFVEATMTEVSKIAPVEAEGDARLGIWGTSDADTVDKGPQDSLASRAPVQTQDLERAPHLVLPTDGGSRKIISVADAMAFAKYAAEAFVQELSSVVRPSDSDWIALKRIYMRKICPIFPIFEAHTLDGLASQEPSLVKDLIKASVCLAAASDRDAPEHLFLRNPVTGPWDRQTKLVSYSEYSQTLVNFIKEGVRMLPTKESVQLVNKIRIMALTCIYWQPEPSSRTEPLDFYACLASMVHTYGIHLKEMVDTNEPNSEGIGRGDVGRLFRCLYAIDRLTSALSGRPLMFHNYDLLMIPQSDKNDSPSFKLFMSIIMLLDKTINLYRPHAKEDHIDVPVLERLILDAGALYEPDGILATLEILYHAVCVTSVRMPRDRFKTSPQMDAVSGVTYSHLPPSILNARRSHSSDRIFDIVKEGERYTLSPMPFIPYALALSLTTAYRKWRFSRTPMFRVRGKENFREILPLLKELGKVWTSARINSNLGEMVMAHVGQAEHNIKCKAGTAGRKPQAAVSRPTQRRAQKLHRRGLSKQSMDTESTEVPTPIRQEQPTPASGTSASADQSPEIPQNASLIFDPLHNSGVPLNVDFLNDGNFGGGSLGGNDSLDHFLTGMDMDDTAFQSWSLTDTVDSCFVSNLDPGCPFSWPEYSNGYQT
ncbi:hypothetical protein QBC47DRAFT_54197 [Echria macrotheca]|uniref:Transcription factor domain-containing protein n=1 Tax=Echria macrotheca TaxID=438768 RepID=A0AAJ0B9I5_9PEZI|nr:hypothetical protein QBC47DRAFT_54197 [Echria macrotheca]